MYLFGYKRCSATSFQRLLLLRDSFYIKQKVCHQKALRAKKFYSIDKWSEKRRMYHDLWCRCNHLIHEMRNVSPDIRNEVDNFYELAVYKARLKQKEEKRQAFLTKYRYNIWFYSNSLTADYGTFTCNICSVKFYHSPARIYLAGKIIHDCCCGNCTNNLIGKDNNGKYPFE